MNYSGTTISTKPFYVVWGDVTIDDVTITASWQGYPTQERFPVETSSIIVVKPRPRHVLQKAWLKSLKYLAAVEERLELERAAKEARDRRARAEPVPYVAPPREPKRRVCSGASRYRVMFW